MVVKLLHDADSGSNKPEKFAVPTGTYAYWYKRPTGFRVAALKPKIDRLAITYQVPDAKHQHLIMERLGDLAADLGEQAFSKASKVKGWGSVKYLRSVTFKVLNGEKVLIQCAPFGSTGGKGYLRLEMNPDKMEPDGIGMLRDAVPHFTSGTVTYPQIANGGRITRIDIAVDLINIDIEDVLIRTKKPGKTHSYFGLTGKIESNYLNVNTKGSDLYVYDRLQKYKDKGLPVEFQGTKYTRVEVRTRTTKPIVELPSLMNHILKIELLDIEAAEPPEDDHHWKMFQDSCRYRGLDAALNNLPAPIREQYEAALTAVGDKLWRPGKLWACWPEVLDRSGLLDANG